MLGRVCGSSICCTIGKHMTSIRTAPAASEEGATAYSLLAQAVVAPTDRLSLGATYLERRSEPAAMGGDDAAGVGGEGERRPEVLGALQRGGPFPFARRATAGDEVERELGATLALKLSDAAVLHGWAAADFDEVESKLQSRQLEEVRPQQWGVLLGSFPDGSGSGWALGVGRSGSAGDGAGVAPNLGELSLQFDMGDGLILTPGMVVMKQGLTGHTAFLGVNSKWTF